MLQAAAALIAAIGAVTVYYLKVKSDRQDEQRRRQERVDDLVQAVLADIRVEQGRLVAAFETEVQA